MSSDFRVALLTLLAKACLPIKDDSEKSRNHKAFTTLEKPGISELSPPQEQTTQNMQTNGVLGDSAGISHLGNYGILGLGFTQQQSPNLPSVSVSPSSRHRGNGTGWIDLVMSTDPDCLAVVKQILSEYIDSLPHFAYVKRSPDKFYDKKAKKFVLDDGSGNQLCFEVLTQY